MTPAGRHTTSSAPHVGTHLLVGLIIAVAAFLRFVHLDDGIPHALGIDEPQIMERAVAMMKTGDFNPRFFDWPSLTIYLQLIVACFTFLTGAMQGLWQHLDQVGPQDMYLNGRALTAAFGTATVWLVYLSGRRWGLPQALFAAALCAVIPYHVRESHYVLADIPAAFFATLTLWLSLRAGERRTLLRFAVAGAAAGLAASAKYNGGLVIVVPLLMALGSSGPAQARVQRVLVIVATAAATFLAGTPYAVLDLPAFLNDYARLAAIFARDRAGEPGWSIYLKHLALALGQPGLWLALAGLVGATLRVVTGPRRTLWLSVLVFPLIYFATMAGSYQIYGRYLMPLLPFASLLAGVSAVGLVARLTHIRLPDTARRLAAAAVMIATLIGPARASVDFVVLLGHDSTVDRAYTWIRDNVPEGARVVIERQVLQLPGDAYAVTHVRSLIALAHAEYAADGVDYLIASSEGYGAALDGSAPREAYIAYRTLFTEADELVVFSPAADAPGPELRVLAVRR